jgi:pyrroloquinoline-quinone synthase
VHREECEKLLNDLTTAEQKKAEHAALTTAKYMWNFLSGVSIKHGIPLKIAA